MLIILARKVERQLAGFAGEYAVACELCRRNVFAQVVYGKWKDTDVLAVNLDTGKSILIEVKTKTGEQWPAVRGLRGGNRVLVFVDFENKGLNKRPDFYIMDDEDWQQYLQKLKAQYPEMQIDDGYIPRWPAKTPGKSDYLGVEMSVSDVKGCQERWEKILDKLK